MSDDFQPATLHARLLPRLQWQPDVRPRAGKSVSSTHRFLVKRFCIDSTSGTFRRNCGITLGRSVSFVSFGKKWNCKKARVRVLEHYEEVIALEDEATCECRLVAASTPEPLITLLSVASLARYAWYRLRGRSCPSCADELAETSSRVRMRFNATRSKIAGTRMTPTRMNDLDRGSAGKGKSDGKESRGIRLAATITAGARRPAVLRCSGSLPTALTQGSSPPIEPRFGNPFLGTEPLRC